METNYSDQVTERPFVTRRLGALKADLFRACNSLEQITGRIFLETFLDQMISLEPVGIR